MPKKNSLGLVPYGVVTRYHGGIRYEVRTLLEYTYGKPGEETHVGYEGRGHRIDWVPNTPFEATLMLDRLERGRSAARFWFIDTEGTHYPVFGQGLVEMLQGGVLDHGVIEGTWIAVKRGANYGIERYED